MANNSEATNDHDLPLEYHEDGSRAAPAKKAARKAAAKKVAAKKAPRKTARKSVSSGAEAAPAAAGVAAETAPAAAPAERPSEPFRKPRDEEFRPTDFKGRGSHFDGVDRIAVAAAPASVPTPAPTPARSEERSDPPAPAPQRPDPVDRVSEQPQRDNRPQLRDESDERDFRGKRELRDESDERDDRGGQQGNQHKQGFGNKKNKNKHQPFQKGNKHGKHPQHGGGGGGPQQHGGGNQPQGGGKFNKQGKQGSWRQPAPPSDRDFVEGEIPNAAPFASKSACDTLWGELDQSATIDLAELYELKVDPLVAACKGLGVAFEDKPGRKQALEALFKMARESKRALKDVGYLDLTDDGYGFVVHAGSNYQLKPESVYVPASLVSEYGLKRGHLLEVVAKAPEEGERCPAALRIVSAMGMAPEEMAKVVPFEDLTPYYPTERLVLETPMPTNAKKDVSMRVFDLLTPIGFGQRGLIVAPPRTGKTVLLQGLANSIQENYPDIHLIVLLVDERPEEVTDFKRNVRGEIVSSTFDETATSHVHAAEMVVEKARRMVEHGQKVVILLDSITRLARAYNTLASNSGKIMTGGIEATALQKPKRFFGSARNIEEGGSLTIMGTALVETGSKMDEVIFEEFKGTGNMETHLDRDLINKRIFPAINFERSGTRKEELLYHPQEMEKVYSLRRVMQGVPATEAMEMLIKRLKVTKNNIEFLMTLK